MLAFFQLSALQKPLSTYQKFLQYFPTFKVHVLQTCSYVKAATVSYAKNTNGTTTHLCLTTHYSIITRATAVFHTQNGMADSIPAFPNQASAENR